MNIDTLILSSGGTAGFQMYGVIKYLSINNKINIEKINTIYSVSVGSIIATLITLNINWEDLDDYLIKRPWHKSIKIELNNLLNIFTTKGILDYTFIKELINPLLKINDLNENITLKEFYEFNKKDIHFFSTNINKQIPEKIDFNYLTYPDLELYKAIYRSSCFPIIFEPSYDLENCYIDGGLLDNFPISDYIKTLDIKKELNLNNVLGLKIETIKNSNINKNTSLYEYIYNIIKSLVNLSHRLNNNLIVDYTKLLTFYIIIDNKSQNFSEWNSCLYEENLRLELINYGIKIAEDYINNENL